MGRMLFTLFIFCSVISAATDVPALMASVQWSFFNSIKTPVKGVAREAAREAVQVVEAILTPESANSLQNTDCIQYVDQLLFYQEEETLAQIRTRPLEKAYLELVEKAWEYDLSALWSIVQLYQKGGLKVVKNPLRSIDYLYDIIRIRPDHQEALELLLRYDKPQPGDATRIDLAKCYLSLEEPRLISKAVWFLKVGLGYDFMKGITKTDDPQALALLGRYGGQACRFICLDALARSQVPGATYWFERLLAYHPRSFNRTLRLGKEA